jgi:hypothetical protein
MNTSIFEWHGSNEKSAGIAVFNLVGSKIEVPMESFSKALELANAIENDRIKHIETAVFGTKRALKRAIESL